MVGFRVQRHDVGLIFGWALLEFDVSQVGFPHSVCRVEGTETANPTLGFRL